MTIRANRQSVNEEPSIDILALTGYLWTLDRFFGPGSSAYRALRAIAHLLLYVSINSSSLRYLTVDRFELQWANGSMEVPVAFSRLDRLRCILSSEEFFVFHTDGSNKLLHSLAYREKAYLHYVKDSYIAKVESVEPTSFLRTTQEPDYILEGTTDLNFVEGDEFRLLKHENHRSSFDGLEPDSS